MKPPTKAAQSASLVFTRFLSMVVDGYELQGSVYAQTISARGRPGCGRGGTARAQVVAELLQLGSGVLPLARHGSYLNILA